MNCTECIGKSIGISRCFYVDHYIHILDKNINGDIAHTQA